MPRLYRPPVPLEVKCRVALRQLGEPAEVSLEMWRRNLGVLLVVLRGRLAKKFGCEIADLRLDHDPPLGARPKARRGLGRKTYYIPDADDSAHLFYRPHGPEHEGSHLIKTNVRGDHGQHPDRVLIKKNRRIERGPRPKRCPKMQSRGFTSSTDKLKPKMKWAKRKFDRRAE